MQVQRMTEAHKRPLPTGSDCMFITLSSKCIASIDMLIPLYPTRPTILLCFDRVSVARNPTSKARATSEIRHAGGEFIVTARIKYFILLAFLTLIELDATCKQDCRCLVVKVVCGCQFRETYWMSCRASQEINAVDNAPGNVFLCTEVL